MKKSNFVKKIEKNIKKTFPMAKLEPNIIQKNRFGRFVEFKKECFLFDGKKYICMFIPQFNKKVCCVQMTKKEYLKQFKNKRTMKIYIKDE